MGRERKGKHHRKHQKEETETAYAERKKASISFTQDIISNNNLLLEWLELFNNHKKKDDLADSFLQGRWYLRNTILKEKVE